MEINMTLSLLSVAILLVFVTVAGIEIYRCIAKGFRYALISLGTVVTSLIISLALSPLISEPISDLIFNLFIGRASFYRSIERNFPSAETFLEAAICMVISSFLFVLVFFIFRLVVKLIVFLTCKNNVARNTAEPEYSEEKRSYFDRNNKFFSILVGSLSAVLVTMIITCPVMGTLDVVDTAFDATQNASGTVANKIGEENMSIVKGYSDDLVGNIFYQLGGKLIYRGAASADMYGKRVCLLTEVKTLDKVAKDFISIYEVIRNPKNATNEHVDVLYELCADIEQLEMCDGILADGLASASAAWMRDKPYLNINKPVMNALVEPAFNDVLRVCTYTNRDSVKQNLTTLLKMYAVILDSGIVYVNQSDLNAVIACVNRSNVIDRLNNILENNPYMSGISVSSVALSAVSQYLDKNYDGQKYNELMNDIADAVNAVNSRGYGSLEEKAEVLSSYVKKHINDYGISIPETISMSTAEGLLKSLTGYGSEVTSDDIREIFVKFLE